MDGLAFEDNMMALGLSGGRGRLPAIAIGNKVGFTVPFSDVLPLNHHAIASFTSDFLNGKNPIPCGLSERSQNNREFVLCDLCKNSAARPEVHKEESFIAQKGLREKFGDGLTGHEFVRQ